MSKPDEATRLRRQMHEQRFTLRSQTRQLDRLRAEATAFRRNLRDAWAALRMIREAVETLGPVGAMPSEEHVACAIAPTPDAEAEAIIAGIRKIDDDRVIVTGEGLRAVFYRDGKFVDDQAAACAEFMANCLTKAERDA